MLPQSQLVLIVILIVLALLILQWDASNSLSAWDDLPEEGAHTEPKLQNQDHNQVSS